MEKEYFNSKFENLTDYNTLSVQEKQNYSKWLIAKKRKQLKSFSGILKF